MQDANYGNSILILDERSSLPHYFEDITFVFSSNLYGL